MKIADPFRFYVTAAAVILVAVLLFFGGRAVLAWDQGRIDAAFGAGVAAEKDRWTSAQSAAGAAQNAAQGASRGSSYQATDAMREGLVADAHERDAATQDSVDTITRGFTDAPPFRCTADDLPRALPDGVLVELDKAAARARAAGRAAGAAAR